MTRIVTPVSVPERECPRCGQRAGGEYSVCPQCGATLPKPAQSSAWVVLGLVLALIGGVVAFLVHG